MNLAIPSTDESLRAAPTWTQLLARMNNNQQLLKDVLRLMSREAPRLSQAFRHAIERNNLAEARRAAHTLKSNCRQFDLTDFGEFAAKLEVLTHTASPEELRQYIAPIESIGAAIADWIDTLLDSDAAH